MKMNFTALALLFVFAGTSHAIEIEDGKLQTCFSKKDRLVRLRCYDNLLGRPNDGVPLEKSPSEATEKTEIMPSKTEQIYSQLQVNDSLASGKIRFGVFDSNSEKRVEIESSGGDKKIYPVGDNMNAKEYETFRITHDIWFAIDSVPEIGANIPMIFGCDNNITTVRFPLPELIKSQILPVQVYWGRELHDFGASVDTAMRVIDRGRIIEAPRGLESIHLLNQVAGSDLMQLSYSHNQDNISAFYSIEHIRDALVILGRHCEWK